MAMTNYSDFEKLAVYFEQKQVAMVGRLEPDVRRLYERLTAIKLNHLASSKNSKPAKTPEPSAAVQLQYRLEAADDLTAIVDQILVDGPDSVDIEIYDDMPERSIDEQIAETAQFILELERDSAA